MHQALLLRAFVSLIDTPAEAVGTTRDYLTVCFIGIPFAHNFVSIVCARVPLVYLASEMYPDTLYPMGLATCFGSVLSCVICIVAYQWVRKKIIS